MKRAETEKKAEVPAKTTHQYCFGVPVPVHDRFMKKLMQEQVEKNVKISAARKIAELMDAYAPEEKTKTKKGGK